MPDSAQTVSEYRSRDSEIERFHSLVERGFLSEEDIHRAEESAAARGIELERLLLKEYHVPRRTLLETLSEYYRCPLAEYDERMPVNPGLLHGLDSDRLFISRWFPFLRYGETVTIAANDPADPEMVAEVKRLIKAERYEFHFALSEDIQWFIQDFMHTRPGHLIGTERTGLAFWRNTMAQWRTRLACYRNDLAMGRTGLAFLRWGLGLMAIADTLIRTGKLMPSSPFYLLTMAAGLSLGIYGLTVYLKVRRARMRPPGEQTIVEVTAATLQFLENYHFLEGTGLDSATKKTMLGRLGDFLDDHCTIMFPSPASRERTHLARERNVLAAQRTVAACYRTLFARSRTGLAFIRSGAAFLSIGLGLIRYFGLSFFTVFDFILALAGLLMIADGALWYFAVRKEQAEMPRCPVPQ